MRVTSDLWVAAFLRRVQAQGAFAVIARKGAAEAGAIFIRVEGQDRACDLFAPAPQTAYDDERPVDERRFVCALRDIPAASDAVQRRLAREIDFDPDIWIVDVEDRDKRHFLGDLLAD